LSDRGEEADPVAYTKEVANIYPSNADVVYAAKASTAKRHSAIGAYAPTELKKAVFGNTPAGKGHYILPAFDRNRSLISGIAGLYNQSRDKDRYRPTSVEFFSGRVFFLMPDGKILYSQTIEDRDFSTSEKCYQEADPTAEDINELVATDGGTMVIQEVGEAYKLTSTGTELLLFADNGVWSVSGSDQSNFKSTDFRVRRITNIGVTGVDTVITAESNVIYWGQGGIYILSSDQVTGDLQAQNISEQTIQEFYNNILPGARASAKGFYDERERKVMWMYNDTAGYDGVSFKNKYNRILFFDVVRGSFYTYTVEFQDQIPYMTSLLQKEATGNRVVPKDVILTTDFPTGTFVTTWTLVDFGALEDLQIELPIVGVSPLNFSVDWGDGTQEIITSSAGRFHTYSAAGTYTVTIGGTMPKWDFGYGSASFNNVKIRSVEQWGNIEWGADLGTFMVDCQNIVFNAPDVPDFSNVTDLNFAFAGCVNITSFPPVDVSNVTNFNGTWRDCSSLTVIPASLDFSSGTTFNDTWRRSGITSFPTFNFSSATTMDFAWAQCDSLVNMSSQPSTTNVTSFAAAWAGCHSLKNLSVNMTSVTDIRELRDGPYTKPVSGPTALETLLFTGLTNNTGITGDGLFLLSLGLSDTALNQFFAALGTNTTTNTTLYIAGNPGAATSDHSIANNKGWLVDDNFGA